MRLIANFIVIFCISLAVGTVMALLVRELGIVASWVFPISARDASLLASAAIGLFAIIGVLLLRLSRKR